MLVGAHPPSIIQLEDSGMTGMEWQGTRIVTR
jgi:hypothetical protein